MSNPLFNEIPLYSASELATLRGRLADPPKSESPGEKKKHKALQVQFLQAAEDQDPAAFLEYFTSRCDQDDTVQVAFRSEPFSEKELSHPPVEVEKGIYRTLIELPPRLAARPSFWNSYHLEMMRRKTIEPSYLAHHYGKSSQSGRAHLQHALEKKKEDLLFQSVRNILRHLGGLPEKRGHVSVYTDCSVSRAWWRGFISYQVAEDTDLDVNRAWETLRITEVWNQLMGYSVERLTAISDRSIRSAFIACLAQASEDARKEREFNQGFLGEIGERCAYQSLGALAPRQNFEIFRGMYGNGAAGQ